MDLYNRLNTGMDKTFEDFVGDAEQRDGAVALGIPRGLVWFGDRHYVRFPPDFWDFELAQAEG